MKTVRLFDLHPGQKAIRDSEARFKIVMAGRRFGKTMFAAGECLKRAVNNHERIWWVAPSFPIAMVAWRALSHAAAQLPGTQILKKEMTINFPGGGCITIKSADKENSLRSEGLDGLVMDEGAFIRETAWTHELRPALVDKGGWALFFSTPNGRNWYWRVWKQAEQEDDWEAFQFASSDNPHIDKEELAAAREVMPKDVFEQEHLAKPRSGAGAVFTNIQACLNAPKDATPEDHKGHMLIMTIDWAKHKDFTVICVGCGDCKQELELIRFNEIDYTVQRDRVKEVYEKWKPEIVIGELNAMGEVNCELLWEDDIPVTGWWMSASNKPGLIRSLATALQRAEWQFLDIPAATYELEAFEQKTNPITGRSTYSAPKGSNDDTVIARALLVWAEANMGHVPIAITE